MTDKKTEALKLALKKAFDLGKRYWQQANSDFTSQWRKSDVTLASFNQLVEDTIRDALAEQPAQQQEPVAWISDSPTKGNGKQLHWTKAEAWRWSSNITPLYTAPPKREWVGLNNVEVGRLTVFDGLHHVETLVLADFIRAIEAKLREKNGF